MSIGSSEDLAKLAVIAAVLLIGLGAWVATIYYSFRTVACLKPGLRLWRDAPAWNPFNHILRTAHLNRAGVEASTAPHSGCLDIRVIRVDRPRRDRAIADGAVTCQTVG
jgi:hypothetical protein